MGIIIRQSIKGTIISYLGAFLGMLLVIFIMPYFLSSEQIGILRLLTDAASFFAILSMFGGSYSLIYFYPKHSNAAHSTNGFFTLVFMLSMLGYMMLVIGFTFFKNSIIQFYGDNGEKLAMYFTIFLPLVLVNIIQLLLEAHANNLLRIVVPKVLREIFSRIGIILCILLYYFKIIDFYTLLSLQVGIVGFNVVLLILYVRKISNHSFTLNYKSLPDTNAKKDIIKYSMFLVLGVMGSILANKLDSFILSGTTNGLSKNGIFTTSLFIITMIEIPGRSLLGISTPIITESLANNDIDNINKLYKKTSTTLFLLGSFIFLCIWANADNLFAIMPNGNEYKAGKLVLLFLGISKLLDAVTSINLIIISNSKYYKYSLLFQLLLGATTILTAYLLIPKYGINGAALSTAISIFVYQSIITLFVWIKYKIIPFSLQSLIILLLILITIGIMYFIPDLGNAYLNIFLKVLLVGIFYLFALIKFNLSDELSAIVKSRFK